MILRCIICKTWRQHLLITDKQAFQSRWVTGSYWWCDRRQKQPDEFWSVLPIFFLHKFRQMQQSRFDVTDDRKYAATHRIYFRWRVSVFKMIKAVQTPSELTASHRRTRIIFLCLTCFYLTIHFFTSAGKLIPLWHKLLSSSSQPSDSNSLTSLQSLVFTRFPAAPSDRAWQPCSVFIRQT